MAGDSTQETKDNSAEIERCRRESRQKLEQWLNKSMRIRMADGRTLIGIFLCTDCDCNIIMGSCEEYLRPPDSEPKEDPRILGLAMIPGKHVLSIEIDNLQRPEEDESNSSQSESTEGLQGAETVH